MQLYFKLLHCDNCSYKKEVGSVSCKGQIREPSVHFVGRKTTQEYPSDKEKFFDLIYLQSTVSFNF